MKKNNYKLAILNSVQYQTSCGMVPLNKTIRDANWINLWNNGVSKDLIDRINTFIKRKHKYNEIHVINLFTFGYSGLHFYVNKALRNNKIIFLKDTI